MAFFDCLFEAKTAEGNEKTPLYLHYEQGTSLQVMIHPSQKKFKRQILERVKGCELYPEPNEFFRQDKYGNLQITDLDKKE